MRSKEAAPATPEPYLHRLFRHRASIQSACCSPRHDHTTSTHSRVHAMVSPSTSSLVPDAGYSMLATTGMTLNRPVDVGLVDDSAADAWDCRHHGPPRLRTTVRPFFARAWVSLGPA